MGRAIPLGRLFGTDIFASLGFFFLLALIYWLFGRNNPGGAAALMAAVVVSLLVHEFGHVFAVKWLLHDESKILLWFLGGLCIHRSTSSPAKQVGISLMGPGFAAVLAGLAAIAYFTMPKGEPSALRFFVTWLLWINVIWTAFNLLPIMPLDGGQALRALLHLKLGRGRSASVTRWVSILTSAAAGIASYSIGYRFAAIMCLMLLLENLWKRDVPYH
jgi:Zn-dependent protease